MQILKLGGKTLPFMKLRKFAMTLSTLLILASFVSFFTKGLNFGLDFTGGTAVEVGFTQAPDLKEVRDAITESGFEDFSVQLFGSSKEILVRLAPQGAGVKAEVIGNQIITALQKVESTVEMRRIEFVGPSVGEDLKEQGGLAMLTALICILIYVAFRFEWRFAVGAVSALLHDVIITLGLFSVLGLEFDLTILAAILAVIGYSLNDTIVVFDRIRETFRKMRKGRAVEVMNNSINQTLRRTILTSSTTLLVVATLLLIGGEVIKGFSTALFIGILVGTYSSIFIASPVVLGLGISREDMLPVKKEEAEADGLP